ncbi:MAG TPA: polysaccharide biosynthesis C-terminal domain-containing protein, partial [Solirubrobacteraceae bacterium]|nr:polysaccharide biosynthesis C-terminal domain-containing protein [Solirubrobacteraceae bacterium]
QHGAFGARSTADVSSALFWFSFSLPTSGVNLLLTRTFFSLQRPWITTWISAVNLAVNAGVSIALYRPLGIAGIVIGTAVGSAAMSAVQVLVLRRELHGRLEVGRTTAALVRMLVAAAVLGGVTWVVWDVVDAALGRGLAAQVIAVGAGLAAGAAAYGVVVLALRIPEARQIAGLVRRRLRPGA